MELVIISGLSGAGKSRVAAILEDLGFYCVDNMPVSLMPKFTELCLATQGKYERVAIVTDVRAREDFGELFMALDEIQEMGCDYQILFVEAELEAIVKRYKETRRRHPMANESGSIEVAIRREMERLKPVRERANLVIDSSDLTIGQLQRKLYKAFDSARAEKGMHVSVVSFGFKNGLPLDADLVFDVRFLPNPFYQASLKEYSGLDQRVREFIFKHDMANDFFARLTDMMDFLLPLYVEEGKTYLVICIGCTGGQHRSVAMAKALADHISEKGYEVECSHRDL